MLLINPYRFAAAAAPTDPNFANVSLLLHGDGTNGSTNIIDSSPSPKTVTAVGNAQISTAQSKFGGASLAFDGTGDYLTISDSTAFNFGAGDFTVELWIYLNSISSNQTFCSTADPIDFEGFFLGGVSSTLYFICANETRQWSAMAIGGTLSTGTWMHVCGVRNGNNFTSYINGVAQAATTNSITLANTNNSVKVGGRPNEQQWMNGYIDDLRITKGIARYDTANFTPPTAPFPDA